MNQTTRIRQNESIDGNLTVGGNITTVNPIVARANCTTAFVTSTTTPIDFDTIDFDTASAITTSPSAWKFTAPSTGYYEVSLSLNLASNSIFDVYVNGADKYTMVAVSNTTANGNGFALAFLNSGDFLDIRPTTGSGPYTLNANPANNWVIITKVT
jgi:hypothetical protein